MGSDGTIACRDTSAGAGAVQRDCCCSASHSMEAFAETVLVGCGLRRCSSAAALRRYSSKMFWPGKGVLSVPERRELVTLWREPHLMTDPWIEELARSG